MLQPLGNVLQLMKLKRIKESPYRVYGRYYFTDLSLLLNSSLY